MIKFKVGDTVVCIDSAGSEGMLNKYNKYKITDIHHNGDIAVDNIYNGFGWRPGRFVLAEENQQPDVDLTSTKTGGSTPNQYRLSVNLPLTSDRTQFADVDLEALDVIDALDLSGNMKDVQKALFRMGKKQGVSTSYDLNKCLFYVLREMKKREIISHGKFWEVSEMLDKMLNEKVND